jgi:CO/xanthine dehydrogenase Mo-binding subunit
VTIAADGAVTLVSPPAEMGQGTFTAMGAVLAEELDVDWSQVTLRHPPVWDEKNLRQSAMLHDRKKHNGTPKNVGGTVLHKLTQR